MITFISAIAEKTPSPLRIAREPRYTGAAKIISSLPDSSSEAQPETSVAAAMPATINSICTSSWRKPPAEVRSKPGNTFPIVLATADRC
jgi:hypothetical protein